MPAAMRQWRGAGMRGREQVVAVAELRNPTLPRRAAGGGRASHLAADPGGAGRQPARRGRRGCGYRRALLAGGGGARPLQQPVRPPRARCPGPALAPAAPQLRMPLRGCMRARYLPPPARQGMCACLAGLLARRKSQGGTSARACVWCRCPRGAAGALPEAQLTVQADQTLECKPAAWRRAWRPMARPPGLRTRRCLQTEAVLRLHRSRLRQ